MNIYICDAGRTATGVLVLFFVSAAVMFWLSWCGRHAACLGLCLSRTKRCNCAYPRTTPHSRSAQHRHAAAFYPVASPSWCRRHFRQLFYSWGGRWRRALGLRHIAARMTRRGGGVYLTSGSSALIYIGGKQALCSLEVRLCLHSVAFLPLRMPRDAALLRTLPYTLTCAPVYHPALSYLRHCGGGRREEKRRREEREKRKERREKRRRRESVHALYRWRLRFLPGAVRQYSCG